MSKSAGKPLDEDIFGSGKHAPRPEHDLGTFARRGNTEKSRQVAICIRLLEFHGVDIRQQTFDARIGIFMWWRDPGLSGRLKEAKLRAAQKHQNAAQKLQNAAQKQIFLDSQPDFEVVNMIKGDSPRIMDVPRSDFKCDGEYGFFYAAITGTFTHMFYEPAFPYDQPQELGFKLLLCDDRYHFATLSKSAADGKGCDDQAEKDADDMSFDGHVMISVRGFYGFMRDNCNKASKGTWRVFGLPSYNLGDNGATGAKASKSDKNGGNATFEKLPWFHSAHATLEECGRFVRDKGWTHRWLSRRGWAHRWQHRWQLCCNCSARDKERKPQHRFMGPRLVQSAEGLYPYSVFKAKFMVQRITTNYVWKFMIPTSVLNLVAILTFFVDSPDNRVSICATLSVALLAMKLGLPEGSYNSGSTLNWLDLKLLWSFMYISGITVLHLVAPDEPDPQDEITFGDVIAHSCPGSSGWHGHVPYGKTSDRCTLAFACWILFLAQECILVPWFWRAVVDCHYYNGNCGAAARQAAAAAAAAATTAAVAAAAAAKAVTTAAAAAAAAVPGADVEAAAGEVLHNPIHTGKARNV